MSHYSRLLHKSNQLLLAFSFYLCPKVITLSDFHCNRKMMLFFDIDGVAIVAYYISDFILQNLCQLQEIAVTQLATQ